MLSLDKWLDAILPTRCACCDDPCQSLVLCPTCERTIAREQSFPSTSSIAAAFPYQGAVQKIIQRAKFGKDETRARRLVSYWARQNTREDIIEQISDSSVDAVCFVPLHWRRRLWRGFDLAAIFAAAVARQLKKPMVDLLINQRFDIPLSLSHSKAERERMTTGRYRIKKNGPKPKNLLLVDDVTTSGATLHAAALALKTQGHRIALYALAKTPMKNPTVL